MTLIGVFSENDRLVVLGDSVRLVRGFPPTRASDTIKVVATGDGLVGGALFGDVPVRAASGDFQSHIWLNEFMTAVPAGSPVRAVAGLMVRTLQDPAIPKLAASGGGFLLAGHEQGVPTVFEILCQSKSANDDSLDINVWEIRAETFCSQILLRGIRNDQFRLQQEVGAAFPSGKQARVDWFHQAVVVLENKGELVGPPVRFVEICKPASFDDGPEADFPLKGSIAPSPFKG